MEQITPPLKFCWTKMGAESGEALDIIIRRKEWERQIGSGSFVWGIGQSLGGNVQSVAVNKEPFPVVFSPMLSPAKKIDTEPSAIAMWTHWEDEFGMIHELPKHILVTSRANLPSGKLKKNHYGLVCKSETPLKDSKIERVSHSLARNVTSNKPVGASQVTAVVKIVNEGTPLTGRSYPVAFDANLQYPYYIKLAIPKILSQDEVDSIKRISNLGNVNSWASLVKSLRITTEIERVKKSDLSTDSKVFTHFSYG